MQCIGYHLSQTDLHLESQSSPYQSTHHFAGHATVAIVLFTCDVLPTGEDGRVEQASNGEDTANDSASPGVRL